MSYSSADIYREVQAHHLFVKHHLSNYYTLYPKPSYKQVDKTRLTCGATPDDIHKSHSHQWKQQSVEHRRKYLVADDMF